MSEITGRDNGRTIGPYRLGVLLGRGTTSVVYRGQDTRDGTPVAVKLLRNELLIDSQREASLARFRREAEIGLRLRHPHLTRVLDYGQDDELHFLVMELVEGQELNQVLDGGVLLSLELSLRVIDQLLQALGCIHAAGVVHRDVKPGNLILTRDKAVKLSDFGIACVGLSELTGGGLLGTPSYMAPEQLRSERLDGRADLFSAGAVLHYLLTGRRPFDGTVAEIMYQILFGQVMPASRVNSRVPAICDDVIARALAKAPEHRYATAEEFRTALNQVHEQLQVIRRSGHTGAPAAPAFPPSSGSGWLDLSRQITLVGGGTISASLAALEQIVRFEPARTELDNDLDHLRRRLDDWYLAHVRARAMAGLAQGQWEGGALSGQEEITPTRETALQTCLELGLTTLAAEVAATAPQPERPAKHLRRDWIALVRRFHAIAEFTERLGGKDKAAGRTNDLGNSLVADGAAFTDRLNRALVSPTAPDLLWISINMLRLDAIEMALEELGCQAQVWQVRGTLLVMCSLVMHRVNAELRTFITNPHLGNRPAVTAMMNEIEEVVTLCNRLHADQDASASRGALSIPLTIITEFIGNARALARLMAAELRVALTTNRAAPHEINGGLAQLGALYRFAIGLPERVAGSALRGFGDEIHDLVATVADHVLLASTDPREDPMLATLIDLSRTFMWQDLAEKLLTSVRTASEAEAARLAEG